MNNHRHHTASVPIQQAVYLTITFFLCLPGLSASAQLPGSEVTQHAGTAVLQPSSSQQIVISRQTELPQPTLEQAIGLTPNIHFHFTHPLKIAIIDDGFDIDNPVWAASIAQNSGEIPGNDQDDDHNGKVDDFQGWDFGDNDADVRPAKTVLDKESHGTRVLGVYWQLLQRLSDGNMSNIRILPIKAVCDQKLNNYLKEGYHGIEYAIEQHADIILCSWSGPMIAPEERAIVEKAREKGILIIASAGNFYSMEPMYPGAVPSVINVTAVDRTGLKMKYSNYGMFVDISAPGDSLQTYDPYKNKPTGHLSATSAAAPIVAAVVTAVRASYPDLSPLAIEKLLKNTATPLESRNPHYCGNLGAGMINITGIVQAMQGNLPNNTLRQAQAYIDLQKLNTTIPVRVAPEGKYRNIRFLLQPARFNSSGQPDIKARCYIKGAYHDTLIRGSNLKYPLVLTGDSFDISRASDRQQASAQQGRSWLYYEVMTIDSSILYCGGSPTEISGTEGYIEDGSGEEDYTGRNDCKWLLKAPAGKKLRLNFDQFDTEPKIDQVYIFNGNSTKDPILAIFSGHKIPPAITSWGDTVLIWFITNEENNFKGWRLHYKVIDP